MNEQRGLQERIESLEQENASLLAIMKKNDAQFKDTVAELAERTRQCEQAEAYTSRLREYAEIICDHAEKAANHYKPMPFAYDRAFGGMLACDAKNLREILADASTSPTLDALRERIKRMEEALRPFARSYQGAVQHQSDSALVGGVMGGVTVGDLRRAAKALEATK